MFRHLEGSGGGHLLRAWASGAKEKFKSVMSRASWCVYTPSRSGGILQDTSSLGVSTKCLVVLVFRHLTGESGGVRLSRAWAPSALIALMFRHTEDERRCFGTPLLERGHQAQIVRSDRWWTSYSGVLTPWGKAGAPSGPPPPRAWAPSTPVDLVFRNIEENGGSLGDASSPSVGTKPINWPGV